MTVVRNEYERGENSPFTALFQQVMATAYQAHPYHHPTIGWRSDIEHASVDKLRRFYDTFYWPDNATVILVGDFRPDRVVGQAVLRRHPARAPGHSRCHDRRAAAAGAAKAGAQTRGRNGQSDHRLQGRARSTPMRLR